MRAYKSQIWSGWNQKKCVKPLAPKLRQLPWRTVFGPADVASTFFARRAVLRSTIWKLVNWKHVNWNLPHNLEKKSQSHWCLLDLGKEWKTPCHQSSNLADMVLTAQAPYSESQLAAHLCQLEHFSPASMALAHLFPFNKLLKYINII